MNKELINKYKAEFDHWLNGGKLLQKQINLVIPPEWEEFEEDWEWPIDELAVIINDDYAEFRKALAEGKTIEYLEQSSNVLWHEVQEPDFNLHPTCYRIKPDEPKFKIGDFVRYIHSTPAQALEINNINGNRYYFTNSEMSCLQHELELWTPVKGEWCWFYDNLDSKYSHLAQFYDMNISEDNSLSTFMSSPITKWYYCEPFLNSLPSYLKDK